MPPKNNLVGKRFGRLVVIEEDPIRRNGKICWFCKCDCGKIKEKSVPGGDLISGRVQSCGCLHKEIISLLGKQSKIDITGQRFGKLTVIEDSGKRRPGSEILWLCQCDCGTKTLVGGTDLRKGKTYSCGCVQSKGEEKISQILSQNNLSFIKEKRFDDCLNDKGNKLRFDFYLLDYNCCIEYDGIQHFEKTFFTHDDLTIRQQSDIIKNNYCEQNNIKLIRIPYTDYEKISINYLKERGLFDD